MIERKWISVAPRAWVGERKENNRERVFPKRKPFTGRFPNENSMRPTAKHQKIRPLLAGQLHTQAREKDVLAQRRSVKQSAYSLFSSCTWHSARDASRKDENYGPVWKS